MRLTITLVVFSPIRTSIDAFLGNAIFCHADAPTGEQLTPEAIDSDSRVRRAEQAACQARLRQYASDIALAQLCWQQGRLDRAVALLQRHRPLADGEDLRGIEWHLLWRQTHAEQKVFDGHANPVRALAFLPDDSAVVASDASHTYASPGEIREWSLSAKSANLMIWRQPPPKPATANYYSGFRSLASSPDGLSIAVPDSSKLHVVDRKGRRVKWTAQGHHDFVMAVAYSHDGRIIASGGLDKVVKLWNSDSGKLIATLAEHEWGVLTLAFSPDGQTLAAGCGDDRAPDWSRRTHGELRLWDVPTKRLSRSIAVTSSVDSVDYSSDGRRIAVGMFDGSLAVVDTRDHTTTTIETQSPSPIHCVRFSPDSMSLASASADGRVRLWERPC
ncbi:WD40 repeat domain-containing protein [Novipirellula sp. SH528]|uniref:WD40 repeat domain-containing protein n=1 Tax=Novipirellula sp. SH528 TaxID=3454466 RepID=UPI003FA03761